MVIRKNAASLTAAEKAELVDAIKAIKADGRYDRHVLSHALAPMAQIHRGPAFLPWHRQFILDYEHDLQQASGNPNLALPYWNWAEDAARPDPTTAPVWANDLMGGNGDPGDGGIVKTGPFRQGEWTIINSGGMPAGPLIRTFGVQVPTLSDQSQVDDALSTLPYDASPWNPGSNPSFRNRLEGWYGETGPGLHNRGHVWVGGSMLPMTSPNDPIFFLHHCFVDKIWADWIAQHPGEPYQPQSGGPAGQNWNDLMAPTASGQVTPADMWNHHDLGYRYDTEGPFNLRDGEYSIQQKSTNRFVDAYESQGRDHSLTTRNPQGNDTQVWRFISVGEGEYTIQQKSTNRFVDAHESAGIDFSVMTRNPSGFDTQKWIITPLGDDTYSIQQKSNGRFVDAHESSGRDFSLITRPEEDSDTQRWIILPV